MHACAVELVLFAAALSMAWLCVGLTLKLASLPDWWLQSLLAELERPDLSGDALDQACARMQRLVEGLALPGGLLEQVCEAASFCEGSRGAAANSRLLAPETQQQAACT